LIDIKIVRENVDLVKKALKSRGEDAKAVDGLAKLDAKWREARAKADQLNAERNRISIEIGQVKKSHELEKKTDKELVVDRRRILEKKIKEVESKSEEVKEANEKADAIYGEIRMILLTIPNLPHEGVPVGKSLEDNKFVRKHGEPRKFDFKPKEHWELGEQLGIIDFERGVKMAGHRFSVLKGDGAKLERALINFMLDFHVKKGYIEFLTPHLVTEKTMTGTGQLPKFEIELYKVERDNLYLIPTAEVTLTNMHADEILKEEQLPLKYCAYTPCYRREAGAYGKDIKGMLRQHQFDKVELVNVTNPEQSYNSLEEMIKQAEGVLTALELPWQTIELCTADLGFASAKTYDLEVWLPGQDKYREISSCSNCTDFQARRMNLRFWHAGKPAFPHTLNGSGIAIGRTLIAILENGQQKDGSVKIPKALAPYFGKEEIK